jgi:hypothetical protein
MPSTKAEIVPAKTAAPDIRGLLGPPPLLEGEDPAAYDALYERVKAAVEPGDALEEIWARDVVDLIWETLRLRRLKVKFLNGYANEGLESTERTNAGSRCPWNAQLTCLPRRCRDSIATNGARYRAEKRRFAISMISVAIEEQAPRCLARGGGPPRLRHGEAQN